MKSALIFIFFISCMFFCNFCCADDCPNNKNILINDKNFVKSEDSTLFLSNTLICKYDYDGNIEEQNHGYIYDSKFIKHGITKLFKNGMKYEEVPYIEDKKDGYGVVYDDFLRPIIKIKYFNDSIDYNNIEHIYYPSINYSYNKNCPKILSDIIYEVDNNKSKFISDNHLESVFEKEDLECVYDTSYVPAFLFDNFEKYGYKYGQLKRQSMIKDGKYHGETRKYGFGVLSSIENYENGKKNGKFKSFRSNSKLLSEEIFKDDILVGAKLYDNKGEIFYKSYVDIRGKPKVEMNRKNGTLMLEIEINKKDPYNSHGICHNKDGSSRELTESEIEILINSDPFKDTYKFDCDN